MNKQKIVILTAIVFVTFVIGLTVILLITLSAPNKTTPPVSQSNSETASIQTVQLYCTSSASNDSLTVTWTLPSNTPAGYSIYGELNDLQAQPITFGPLTASQDSYTLTNINGIDTYQVSLWLQNAAGTKSSIINTNQIISSQCTSGTEPTAPVATPTASVTATPTSMTGMSMSAMAMTTAVATATSTATPTPTTMDASTGVFSCGSFTLVQNGVTLTSDTVKAGSDPVTVYPGLSSTGGTVKYTSAEWSISPSGSTLNPSSDNSNAVWTPPATLTGGTSFVVSVNGAIDAANNTEITPCNVTLTLAGKSTLPNTGYSLPALLLAGLGVVVSGIGAFLLIG